MSTSPKKTATSLQVTLPSISTVDDFKPPQPRLTLLSSTTFGSAEFKPVPNQPKSLRVVLKSNFPVNIFGFSRAGVECGEFKSNTLWVRLNSTKVNTSILPPNTKALEEGLQYIDTFLMEMIAWLGIHMTLPTWFTSEFTLKGGSNHAVIGDDGLTTYQFYLHNDWTTASVWKHDGTTGSIKDTPLPFLVKNSGNSFFNITAGIKMVDFVFNEGTNRVDVRPFVNVRKLILTDVGQDKTPLPDSTDYKALMKEEKNSEEIAGLSRTLEFTKGFYDSATAQLENPMESIQTLPGRKGKRKAIEQGGRDKQD